MRSIAVATGVCIVLGLLSSPGVAQSDVAESSASETTPVTEPDRQIRGVVAYPADFFTRYNAVTALEMVRQLPGFTFKNSDRNTRGYAGSAGNVLINQKRPNGKSDSLEDVLNRIPAENVESVELVQGGVPGYETGQEPLVANVNIRGTASRTRTLQLGTRLYDDGKFSPNAEIVQSSLSANRSLTLSGAYSSDHHAWRGTETTTDANGDVISLRRFTDPWTFEEGIVSINLEQSIGDRSSLRVQTRARGFDFIRPGAFINFTPSATGEFVEGVTDISESKRWAEEYEFSPVIDRQFGDDWRAEATLLARSYAFNDSSFSINGSSGDLTRSRLKRTDREFLGRAVITKSLGDQNELEVGIESAANSRDQKLKISIDDGAGPMVLDLPGSNAKVSERRSELYASYIGQATQKIGFEAGLRYEWSTISRTGGDANERSFSFLKPELRIRYDQSPQRQFRVNLERPVGQLSFSDFLSIIDFAQGGQLNGGNPTLSPSARWRVEGAMDQRFSNGSVVTATIFHEWIDDVIDRAPVFGGQFDAPANIGNGRRYGARLEASAPLSPLGLPNARIDVTAAVEDSQVTDPVTGNIRALGDSEQYSVTAEYRHSFPNQKLNLNVRVERKADVKIYRLDQIQIEPALTEVFAFVETTRFKGFVVRVGADYILDEEDDRRFINFVGDRSSGLIAQQLDRRKRQGVFLNMRIRANF